MHWFLRRRASGIFVCKNHENLRWLISGWHKFCPNMPYHFSKKKGVSIFIEMSLRAFECYFFKFSSRIWSTPVWPYTIYTRQPIQNGEKRIIEWEVCRVRENRYCEYGFGQISAHSFYIPNQSMVTFVFFLGGLQNISLLLCRHTCCTPCRRHCETS